MTVVVEVEVENPIEVVLESGLLQALDVCSSNMQPLPESERPDLASKHCAFGQGVRRTPETTCRRSRTT